MSEQTTETLLRAPEVIAQTGCTYRQVDYWTRAGRIAASRAPLSTHPLAVADRQHRNPTGSGVDRLWDPAEVEVIGRVVQLLAAGADLDLAFAAARSTTPVDLGHGIVLTAPWMTT